MLCDYLEGWDGVGDGREVQEGGDTYVDLWLIHVDVWQKPTQYCQAIILQLKINTFKIEKKIYVGEGKRGRNRGGREHSR